MTESYLPYEEPPELPPYPKMGDNLNIEVVLCIGYAGDYRRGDGRDEDDLRDRRMFEA